MDNSISNLIISEDNAGEHLALLTKAIKLGLDFATGADRAGRFIKYRRPSDLANEYAYPVPVNGRSLDRLLDEDLPALIGASVSKGHPRYIAFPDSANSLATHVAEIVSSFLNQNMITFDRGGPAATYVERQLIRWYRELIGFSYAEDPAAESLVDIGGMVTSGGNASNIIAISAAIHRRYPSIRKHGMLNLPKRPLIFVPRDVEHFSYESAACLLGIGEDSIRYVQLRTDFTTDMDDLRKQIESVSDSEEPVAIVVYAGNTRTSSIDNIAAAKDIAEAYGLWLHVDACHGGSLLFSSLHKNLVHGLERADSVTIDPHKTLLCTYPLSLLVFQDGSDLARIGRTPAKSADPGNIDSGQMAPFYGSRAFEALKAWLIIRNIGTLALGELTDQRLALTLDWYDMLCQSKQFIPLHSPQMYKVAFVFCPPGLPDRIAAVCNTDDWDLKRRAIGVVLDRANMRLAQSLYEDGAVCIDTFRLRDLANVLRLGREPRIALGSVVANPSLDKTMLTALMADMRAAAAVVVTEVEEEIDQILSEVSISEEGGGELRDGPSVGPASWAGVPV